MIPMPNYEPPDKIGRLTEEEIDDFLAQPWKIRMAMVTPENRPYIVPLWYEFDPIQRVFYIVARHRSKYVGYIRSNPSVALQAADDLHLENTRIMVDGVAEILVGPVPPFEDAAVREIVLSMSRKYMGVEGPTYAQATADEPRYLIRISPERWTSWTGRMWAAYYRKETQP